MTEWQIIIDSDDFPEPPPEESPQHPRFHSRWLVVVGVLVALLLVAILSLYRQRAKNLTQMRQDLTAAIFEEETVRHFGNPEQAADLIIPNVPDKWQQAYADTFTQGLQPPPTSIEITDIQFGGECAIIDVKLDNNEKTRVYCLNNQQWKRAPITPGVWGREQTTLKLDNEIELYFLPRDQKFAKDLVHDLNKFFDTLSQWGVQVDPKQLPVKIIIQPLELSPSLISSDNQQIVLNSPLAEQTTTLPGRVAVRLDLTQAILSRILPVPAEDVQDLPGAPRLLTAAYTSLGARMLLTESERQDLTQTRQKELGDQWISPFYADLVSPDRLSNPEAPAAAAYLLTEYIVSQQGPEALITLIQLLPISNSWDGVFESILGRTTTVLENDAAQFFQYPPAFTDMTHEAIDMPLPATLASHSTHGATVTLPTQTEPVWVEFLPKRTARTSNGLSLPATCIPPEQSCRGACGVLR